MGQSLGNVQNAITEIPRDIHVTLNELTSTIHAVQADPSVAINQLSEQITESIEIITRDAQQSTTLLRNGFLVMSISMALSVLLYQLNISPLIRAIVWTVYASLCLHMIMTYLRYARKRISSKLHDQSTKSFHFSHSETELIFF